MRCAFTRFNSLARRPVLASFAAAWMLSACAGTLPGSMGDAAFASPSTASAAMQSASVAVPPRLEWAGNHGYCGETAMISAGLFYGQYTSQFDARALASDGTPQNRRDSQLLLGVNAGRAARKMRLSAIEWDTASEPNTNAFLAWVKHETALGYPVTIGVFTNEYRFYGKGPKAGQPDYDHIVPVTGVRSHHSPLDATFYPSDVLTFSDNGLWNPSDKKPQYLFSYRFGAFEKTRAQANARNGTVYSTTNDGVNYGIAMTGVADPNHETLPVRVSTNVNYERPAIVNGSPVRPVGKPLILTVTVSGLRPGAQYTLYRYDRFAAVPTARFNAGAASAARRWRILIASGSTFTVSERILSSHSAIYRAVPLASP